MKTYISLLFVAGILIACNDATAISDTTQDTAHIEEPATTGKVSANTDTFSVGNKQFTILPLAASSFKKQEAPENDTTDAQEIAVDRNRVRRNGDTLIFSLTNGQQARLVNNRVDNGEDYALYFYSRYVPEIQQYLVMGNYYESNDCVLVNAVDGTMTHVWGTPVVSPDRKYIVCGSVDLFANFNNNGLQLFSYSNNKLTAVGDVTFDKWGPGQMKWLNNNTIEAEYITLDKNSSEVIRPVKLLMR
ncbi:hypothetical protein [Chitinophaga rhizophila]|uniref:DKNYY family protein n=1 Tax=Chitinophaga rhizophila TaxID=2866212 RepID=A0ABS7GFA9_9BACT|nr:hypothetical protein [Chitinophaga rhizophila]MBW8685499.1 hypothetical protein [Chitinophaga rhizophila]